MGDSSSPAPASSSNTVTQVQQIPDYEQQFSQENQNLARSLGTTPPPNYQAPIVAPLNAMERTGLGNAAKYADDYKQGLGAASDQLNRAMGQNPTANGDPTKAAGYGAAAIEANNPMVIAQPNVYQNLHQAENNSNQANQMASGANSYGASASSMATGANTFGDTASGMAQSAAGQNPVAGTTAAVNALDPGNAGVIQRYMNPYVQASLAPQLMQAGILQSQQQQGINSQATGANAFGDARQGTQNALQNYYGQQTNAGIEAQGFNTAYTNALNTAVAEQGQQQQLGTLGVNEQNAQTNAANTVLGAGTLRNQSANTVLGAGQLQNATANTVLGAGALNVNAANAATNLANTGVNEQNIILGQQTSEQNYQKILQAQQAQTASLGMNEAQLAQQNQTDTLAAANAQYNAGNIQQGNDQAQLTAAYQQFMNQQNWPFAMLNMRESALSNSPYNISTADTVPPPNSTTQGLSSFATLAGALGALGKTS